jgi:hypothetical protein
MIGTIGLGVPYVSGRSLVPSPPTKTIACTNNPFATANPCHPERSERSRRTIKKTGVQYAHRICHPELVEGWQKAAAMLP